MPRTLTTDFRNRGRIGLQECKETGIFLADALGYMHSHGLTHRDIKPSNIIYVKGAWKLADIGLVAVHGERSYVGTEGFVPPEGPGTFASDIYSLGKVLYEISSGKDRMEFPEVPEDLGAAEWNLWREWNTVICRACAPSLKERYASSADFAAALRMVGVPRPVPLSRRVVNATWHLAVGSVLSGALLAVVQRETAWSYQIQAPEAKKLTPEEIAQPSCPIQGACGSTALTCASPGRRIAMWPTGPFLWSCSISFWSPPCSPLKARWCPASKRGANRNTRWWYLGQMPLGSATG
ncbi:protein kinase domain-containing protein [Verrucomicrobium spinosum]|uniref:protein kinase domain-containing protein n=1 Tax=Verrucomicrobium spinosum TaxID=2736 RepID=UPI0009462C4D|nr:protein kinase [Verrucomicrobium spinosum]